MQLSKAVVEFADAVAANELQASKLPKPEPPPLPNPDDAAPPPAPKQEQHLAEQPSSSVEPGRESDPSNQQQHHQDKHESHGSQQPSVSAQDAGLQTIKQQDAEDHASVQNMKVRIEPSQQTGAASPDDSRTVAVGANAKHLAQPDKQERKQISQVHQRTGVGAAGTDSCQPAAATTEPMDID